MKRRDPQPSACPCGSGQDYAACCGRFLDGAVWPDTAEALMRSRYTAYALGRADWLAATWHPATRPDPLTLDAGLRWIGLKVLSARGGPGDAVGEVEFVARHKAGGRAGRLHERSRFERIDGRWVYRAGVLDPDGPGDAAA